MCQDQRSNEEETLAQYLLSVWHDDTYEVDFESDDMQRIGAKVGALNDELMAAGAMVFGGGLQPAETATVMRPSGDDVAESLGSYTASKVQMGGFWVIEAESSERAAEWARKAALATEGPVELRPFQGG